jgi:hypothetical protein
MMGLKHTCVQKKSEKAKHDRVVYLLKLLFLKITFFLFFLFFHAFLDGCFSISSSH